MKLKLTKRVIDALKPSAARRIRVFDAELTGFGIVVYPSGRKTFVLRYGDRRHRRWMILGDYGPLTVEAARTKAHQFLASVYDGRDPLAEKHHKSETPLFRDWVKEYLKRVFMRKKRPAEDRKYLRVGCEAFGAKALEQVSVEDIERAFEGYVSEGHPTAANRFLASVRACLQDAWRRGQIQENPARKIRHLPEVPPRDRVLSDEELRRFFEAVEKIPDAPVRAAFVLLVTTGARKSEVLSARWEDIDMRNGIWRLPRTKAGRPLVKPVPRYTIGVLQTLTPVPGHSPFLFPGRNPQQGRRDLKRQWCFIRKEAGLDAIRVTDIRRTFGRDMANQAGLHMASRLLGHTDIHITEKHYVPVGMPELRAAVEKRTNEKIVPIRKGR